MHGGDFHICFNASKKLIREIRVFPCTLSLFWFRLLSTSRSVRHALTTVVRPIFIFCLTLSSVEPVSWCLMFWRMSLVRETKIRNNVRTIRQGTCLTFPYINLKIDLWFLLGKRIFVKFIIGKVLISKDFVKRGLIEIWYMNLGHWVWGISILYSCSMQLKIKLHWYYYNVSNL